MQIDTVCSRKAMNAMHEKIHITTWSKNLQHDRWQ